MNKPLTPSQALDHVLAAAGLHMPPENVFGHSHKLQFFLQTLIELRKAKSELVVVDVGCGNGSQVTRYLGCVATRVVGLDLHEPCISYAEHKFGSDKVSFVVTKIEDLQERFDVAVLSDVLEHVEDPEQLLGHVVERLADDGILLISVPNGKGPFEAEAAFSKSKPFGALSLSLLDLCVAVLNKFIFKGAWTRVAAPEDLPYNQDSPHVQFFSEADITTLIERSGFRITSTRQLCFVAGPYSNYLLKPWKRLLRLNVWLGERIPARRAVAWCFVAERNKVMGRQVPARARMAATTGSNA